MRLPMNTIGFVVLCYKCDCKITVQIPLIGWGLLVHTRPWCEHQCSVSTTCVHVHSSH